ncbi:MAG TPA: hypothetical protein H9728_00575 [Candidatus Borkfalkia excrementavium]|uniref:Uncharacterized protein n=1 Tax=Candidatus Borkfalkia excrementavium TaxID=2838505 RepID=A0A9D1Z6A6_9FIRM|nr:hypothetical protein [Candidatus Borkfalkia excrementavium]
MLKKCLAALMTLLLCFAAVAIPQFLGEGLLFETGEYYIFYSLRAGSDAQITIAEPSDAAKIKRSLSSLTGESTVYGDAERAFAQAEKYGARLIFRESAAGTDSYYYYSPRLGGGIELFGELINLHIAVKEGGCAIGSPVIFGGY